MLRTVKYPDPILTTPCEPYLFMMNFNLHGLLDDMAKHMEAEKGIGLAANQVNVPYRIFIMKDNKGKIWEFINPEILESSGRVLMNEGCLSAPGAYVQVPTRAQNVMVRAKDRNGQEFTVICEDLEAVCVQHEMDHLDGVFYLDKTSRNQRRSALRTLGLK